MNKFNSSVLVQGIAIKFPIGLPEFPILSELRREAQLLPVHGDDGEGLAPDFCLFQGELIGFEAAVDGDLAMVSEENGDGVLQSRSEVPEWVLSLLDVDAEGLNGANVDESFVFEDDGFMGHALCSSS